MGTTQASTRRPTPLDPYPEPRTTPGGEEEKAYPPELGTDAIAILEGRTFMYSNSLGDVPAGSIGGLLHDDTRFLSRWELTIDGQPLSLLKSQDIDHHSAAFFLTNAQLGDILPNTLSVRRLRFVGGGLREQAVAVNMSTSSMAFELRLAVDSDFADLFEVKSAVRDRSASITTEHRGSAITFHYEVPGFTAETIVDVERSGNVSGLEQLADSEDTDLQVLLHQIRDQPMAPNPPRVDGTDLVWQIELAPRELWGCELRVDTQLNKEPIQRERGDFKAERERVEGALTAWLDAMPTFESDNEFLTSTVERSISDLAALRISGTAAGVNYVLPAAGLPWFMTLFGRDTLITALQTLWVGPELTRGALHLLGATQGTKVDDFRDEEPGKILHEIRHGELTVLGHKPHSPYFGTADATPLYLILMSEYWRHTDDAAFVRERWSNVVAALEWIDRHGDRDHDGYVEYGTRSSEGLGNQCWKDSWDGVQFADGRIPYLPIATAEIQGYVFDAKQRVAELAERVIHDSALAGRLRDEAHELYERFNRDFWTDARGGYYVIGLDGDKQPIDSMTSNMGHLLYSGIVPGSRARILRDHLMSPNMFSGWGVRTISRQDRGYNPIGYHVGTIWPHDSAMVAMGLARYGFHDEASRIALALTDAASHSAFRLPEAFAGFDRSIARFPVPYPTACSPQAWATGAPFLLVKAMLGLDARDRQVMVDPHLPEAIGRVSIRRMSAFGTLWDVEAIGTNGHVRLSG